MVVVGLIVAGAMAWLAGLVMLRAGPRLGFVDRPGDEEGLKVHRRPAVPLGGVAVLVGAAVGAALADAFDPALFALAGTVVVLGLVDDRVDLAPGVRLLVEVGIAVLSVTLGVTSLDLADPLQAAVGVVLIVVSINAVNLFDGLDALAGSASAVAFGGLAALAAIRGVEVALPLVVVGAVLGFLLLNRPPARLFLGDNGSYLLGFFLAVTVLRSSPDGLGVGFVTAALVLGVFLLDLSVTVLRRRLAGKPLFVGDRSHLYDRLHDRGWSVAAIVLGAAAAEAVFVGAAVLVETVWQSWWAVGLVVGVCVALVAGLARRSLAELSG